MTPLTRVQEQAFELKWEGKLTNEEIGKRVGVRRETIWHWSKLEAWREEWENRKREEGEKRDLKLKEQETAAERAHALLRSGLPAAVATVLKIMTDPNERAADRLMAAKLYLHYGGMEPVQRLEHTGPGGGPVEVAAVSSQALEEQRARIAELDARRMQLLAAATPPDDPG